MPVSDTSIRSFDYLRGLQQIEPEIVAAILRVLRSGQLILGPEGAAFEAEFAEFTQASHAIAVGSGTDALILALMAVGVGPGDEVITVANTAVPTASAICAVGAIPRFVDVMPDSLLMDATAAARAVGPRTRCLLPVHLYGRPVPLEPLLNLARQHDLRVIEDCAHAHGATEAAQHVGTRGDIGCFSFYPTKNLGAYGDGGMCITQNPELADRLRSLRMYGYRDSRIAETDGRNSRLDELQAAVLRVKLRRLQAAVARRRQIAAQYLSGLAAVSPTIRPTCGLPGRSAVTTHAFHQFVIRVPDRAQVISRLTQQGVGYGIHYETPLHHMPAFRRFHDGTALPQTEQAAQQILSLPMYPELTDSEVQRVVQVLLAAVPQRGDA